MLTVKGVSLRPGLSSATAAKTAMLLSAAVAFLTASVLFALPTSAGAAFPGKNGKIAFAGGFCGGICTIGPKGGGMEELTKRGYWPEFSANGRRITFEKRNRIFVMRANGTRQRGLGRGTQPSFSPNGKKIVFAHKGIVVMNTDGSDRTRLTRGNDGDPSFSPDGKWIVFTRRSLPLLPPDTDIWLMPRNGIGARPIKHTNQYETRPDFSPDGKRIAFNRERKRPCCDFPLRDTYTIKLDGSGERLVRRRAEDPVFSPNGRRIAFALRFFSTRPKYCGSPAECQSGATVIATMNRDGSNVKRLQGTEFATVPDWGSKIEPRR
jgi:Tol biopolymer transport system component